MGGGVRATISGTNFGIRRNGTDGVNGVQFLPLVPLPGGGFGQDTTNYPAWLVPFNDTFTWTHSEVTFEVPECGAIGACVGRYLVGVKAGNQVSAPSTTYEFIYDPPSVNSLSP